MRVLSVVDRAGSTAREKEGAGRTGALWIELSLEEKPALGFVAEASLSRGGRGNFPAESN
jgi:hypothetical protein